MRRIRILGSFRHSVVEIFKKLDSADGITDDVMASLEWAFLPLFRFSGRQALALQRALSTTPKFFVEVLCAVYRPSKESGSRNRRPPTRKGGELSRRKPMSFYGIGDVCPGRLMLGWSMPLRCRRG